VLRIRVLGALLIEGSEGPVPVTGSWRARSLVAWLALHPGEHPRGDVAARFWPDVLNSSGRASLRNAIWALRRALGADAAEALVATRAHVGLRGAPDVWIDAAAFAEHVAQGRLDAALELCRGELLAGLDDEWVYDHRDAHRARLSELLERIAVRAQDGGDVSGAIAWTRRRVALDPLAEDAQRALIARLDDAGDRAGAVAAYSRLRERLRRELGVSPSQPTRELMLQVREPAPPPQPPERSVAAVHGDPPGDGGWAPGARFPLPPRLRQPAAAPFVGRAGELARLRGLWTGVRAGRGARLALLLGEPGIGKSRLAREFAAEVSGQGAVVLHGSASEDLLIPYQHFVEALGHYLAVAGPEELRRRAEPRADALEPIAPEAPRASAQPAEGGRSESRRYRLYEAVASLLDELSGEGGVLLVLDDLHWADAATAALLRHALESRPEMGVLVLATQRPAEMAQGGALAEALHRLGQHGMLERVVLEGLLDADVAELSRRLTGRELESGLLRAIREEAAGNPFFVQETVRHLAETGDDGGVLSLSRAGVPEGVREVVNLRLARLGDSCLRLLSVAAVIGTEFALVPLERVSDLQGEDLTAALDQALASGLVLEPHGEDERFAFSHALVRRTLLERLSRAHRRRIHARIAEVLRESRPDALPEIAHHLCEALPAADRDLALDYAVRAAEQATAGLAYAEAVELFTRALSVLPPEHERRRLLALKRALAYQALTHEVMDSARPETRAEAIAGPSGVRA
jgi:DNA-binding SARP family transcriptional activator